MHRMALSLAALFSLLSSLAAQVSSPSPTSGAQLVGSHPVLRWSWDQPNILDNGSFEQGTNGWNLPREATVVTNTPSHGTNALRIIYGALSREITVPSGGPWTLSFAVRDQFSDRGRVSVQIRDTDNQLLRAASFTQDGGPAFSTSRYAVRYVDLTPFAGRTIKFVLNAADFDRVSLLVDDFRLTTAPANVLFDVHFGREASRNMLAEPTPRHGQLQTWPTPVTSGASTRSSMALPTRVPSGRSPLPAANWPLT